MTQIVGPGSSVLWDYPVDEEANIDNFNVYLDGALAREAGSAERSIPIQDLSTEPGDKIVGISAKNPLGESSRASVQFRVVTGVPVAPSNVRVGTV